MSKGHTAVNEFLNINYMDEHRDYFQCVTGGVHRVIGEFLQSRTLLNKTVTRVEESEGAIEKVVNRLS